MRAYRMTSSGAAGTMALPVPDPAAGEVRLAVLAAGLCHSDLHVVDRGGLGWQLPFTFGHEICGRVDAVGPGVREELIGTQVVVHAPVGCGRCPRCVRGRTNYCDHRASLPAAGIGLGVDGGMADTVTVDESRLVPADGLDPSTAAALTDAGLTSYHAVTSCADALVEPGAVAVVIGVGGLGHMAVAILRACTDARIVAVDTRAEALELARSCGAHAVAGPDAAATVAELSQGRGADVVLDFVAAQSTLDVAVPLLRTAGELVLVGGAGGMIPVGKPGPLPSGMVLRLPFWGSREELVATVDLARSGVLTARTTTFPLSEAERAFAELRRGAIVGRAVLVPD
ncbi:alcohol dehydrogenase, propanol-preferring [Pseudonocardia ammonioxydans]|uniref:alcohol dehydrogenase n=1 Tax=Pseudonocardia ammonioxydans TaxID=260086 RepID=A0A1I5BEK0_PSUAM|nr:alcohol dehydrogenase catalytic domain-containing protein [Pseudonocardia ammonioxydans]SFN73112.1 alcohol dehydrogenase, propanol-preferring [Pseudonocardia ammonioxydans]